VFAPHNLIRDAPFTKMDLITLPNLLIYFQPHAQRRCLTLFHFALKPGGFLFLGSSESPGGLIDEFDTIDEHAQDLPQAARHRPAARSEAARCPRSGTRRDAAVPGVAAAGVRARSCSRSTTAARSLHAAEAFSSTSTGSSSTRSAASELAAQDQGRDGPTQNLLELLRRCERSIGVRCIACATTSKASGTGVSIGAKSALRSSPSRCATAGADHTSISSPTDAQGARPGPPLPTCRRARRDPQRTADAGSSRDRIARSKTSSPHQGASPDRDSGARNGQRGAAGHQRGARRGNEELQSTERELHSVNEEMYTVNAEYQKKNIELQELNDRHRAPSSTEPRSRQCSSTVQLCIRKFTPPHRRDSSRVIPQDVGRRCTPSRTSCRIPRCSPTRGA
jgi:two-component system CheB/CheR fusion protein